MFMRYFGGGIGHINQGSQWQSADEFDAGNLGEEEMERAETDDEDISKNPLCSELAGWYESDSDSCEHSDSEGTGSSCLEDSDADSDDSSESESGSDSDPEDGENFYNNEAQDYESL
jgi:hypothetical protein